MTDEHDDAYWAEFYANPENRRPTGPPRRRTRPVNVPGERIRFMPEVIEQVKELAARDGLTVSSWIRRSVDRSIRARTAETSVWADPEFHWNVS